MFDLSLIDRQYIVFPDGGIYSKGRKKWMTGVPDKDGYLRTALRLEFKAKGTNVYIHRIVAAIYLPNPHNLPTVNHKDGDKANNIVTNLEWACHAKQRQHAWDIGLYTVGTPQTKAGKPRVRGILTDTQIGIILALCSLRENHQFIAERMGTTRDVVVNVAGGRGPRYKSYIENERRQGEPLTNEDVEIVRGLLALGKTQAEIAYAVEISPSIVANISSGRGGY